MQKLRDWTEVADAGRLQAPAGHTPRGSRPDRARSSHSPEDGWPRGVPQGQFVLLRRLPRGAAEVTARRRRRGALTQLLTYRMPRDNRTSRACLLAGGTALEGGEECNGCVEVAVDGNRAVGRGLADRAATGPERRDGRGLPRCPSSFASRLARRRVRRCTSRDATRRTRTPR